MAYEPPTYSDEEIIAAFEASAAHWEKVASESSPDDDAHCIDYAKHLRTLAECKRMDMMEREVVSD